jgi:hypothetical protein
LPFQENFDAQGLERVRLAVVKLAGGSLAELRRQVEVAKQDWRDVLAPAEEPEAMRAGFSNYGELDAEARRDMEARDRQQYEEWLHGDGESDPTAA